MNYFLGIQPAENKVMVELLLEVSTSACEGSCKGIYSC